MRVLVTGATGFVGGWMVERLLAEPGWLPMGVSRQGVWPPGLANLGSVAMGAVDWSDRAGVAGLIHDFQPQGLIHLAGYASAGQSFRDPQSAWVGNLGVTRMLYQALEDSGVRPRVLHVGTGLVYAPPDGDYQILDEDAPLGPASPYAASKLAAECHARMECARLGLEVIVARPFNHIGPRQDPQFALASFARQIARMEKGLQPAFMETGNLSPARDLSDVRDIVEAYCLLLKSGASGQVYNLGSGQAVKIGDALTALLDLSRVPVTVTTRADLLRPGEPEVFRANTTRLRRDTGWIPQYPLDQTLADLLEWCRIME